MLPQECPVDVGKKATLGMWYDTHGPRLLAMLEYRLDRRSASRRGADDILHQAFVKAEKRWDDFARSGMTPYAWLYRLAQDCLNDDHDYQTSLRRNVRRDRPVPERSSEQMVLGLFRTSDSPSNAAKESERVERLRARMAEALDALSPDDHQILVMRHFDNLKSKEIAQVLGIEANAASVRYARARARLLEVWVARFGEEDFPA